MENTTLKQCTMAQLRKSSGDTKQSVVALMMNCGEPAVSKLEKKRVTDVTLDKLIQYAEAIGGEIELSIKLPDGQVIAI